MNFDIKKPSWTLVSIFVVLLLFIDQLTKVIIKLTMTIGEAIYVCGTWFQIRFIENPGAAYGFEISDGDWGKLTLSVIRIIAIFGLGYYIHKLMQKSAPIGVIVGFSLILAGALGNLIDSMFYGLIFSESTAWQVASTTPWGEGYTTFLHGKVVDMLYFPIIDTHYPEWLPKVGGERFIFFSPIFNVADSYISVGFVYLIIFQRKYFNEKPEVLSNEENVISIE